MENNSYKGTNYMKKLVSDSMEQITPENNLYCYEDFIQKIKQVQSEAKTSSYGFRIQELKKMLDTVGVSYTESDFRSRNKLMERIKVVPKREAVLEKLFQQLYKIYLDFPSPADYMERLVNRLGDMDFADDSIRLRIVKQFLRHTSYNTQPIIKHVIAACKVTLATWKEDISQHLPVALEKFNDVVFDKIDPRILKNAMPMLCERFPDAAMKSKSPKEILQHIQQWRQSHDVAMPEPLLVFLKEVQSSIERALEKLTSDKKINLVLEQIDESIFKLLTPPDASQYLPVMLKQLDDSVFDKIDQQIVEDAMKMLCEQFPDTAMHSKSAKEILQHIQQWHQNHDETMPEPLLAFLTEIQRNIENEILAAFGNSSRGLTRSLEKREAYLTALPSAQNPAAAFSLMMETLDDTILNQIQMKIFENNAKMLAEAIPGFKLKRKPYKTLEQVQKWLSEEQKELTEAMLSFLKAVQDDIDRILKAIQTKKENLQMREAYSNEKRTISESDDWTLLKLADDLANGKFRTNGKTRKDLYLFAMAFNMTVSIKGLDEEQDQERDVEKNLFHDYYNNNLMRFLTECYKKDAGSYQAEPTGEGINYKNFAEVIYLYYIRKAKLSPKDKIKQAEAMIASCVKMASKPEFCTKIKDSKKDWGTQIYRKQLSDVNFFLMNEKELQNYICKKYYIPRENTSKLLYVAEQRTAFQIYQEILQDLEQMNYAGMHVAKKQEDSNNTNPDSAQERTESLDYSYILLELAGIHNWDPVRIQGKSKDAFVAALQKAFPSLEWSYVLKETHKVTHTCKKNDAATKKKYVKTKRYVKELSKQEKRNWIQEIPTQSLHQNTPNLFCNIFEYTRTIQDENFQKLISSAIRFADSEIVLSSFYKDNVVNSNDVTRTSIIAIYAHFYYYDMLENCANDVSFYDMYNDFCDGINSYLENARYQQISEKNFFDMFIVFSLYHLLYIENL